ncbi:MAG: hypothetical protein CMN58_00170 [Solibacterales bacterium]|nr:hypothetical protein [Bryobacterales bacterium]|tara:strand:- start:12772 stop:15669 length:2898 start_codon:yes stop_codon:yes gene_type:complete
MCIVFRLLYFACLFFIPWGLKGAEIPPTPSFEEHISEIFTRKCIVCHGSDSPQGGLSLTTSAEVLRGGKTGPAVVVGSAERSLLVAKVVSGAMPPINDKLTASEIAIVRAWIDGGALSRDGLPVLTEKDAIPIFQMRCVNCHGKRRREGDLDLRTLASALKGGKSGPAIVRGNPGESLVLHRIKSGEMPPPEMLFENQVRPPSNEEVEVLQRWIAEGAQDDNPQQQPQLTKVSKDDQSFWAFKAPIRTKPPPVKHSGRVHNPIDQFLLAALEKKGLTYSPRADSQTLVRRAYLDLIGMPPTPEEMEAFMEEPTEEAYGHLIDRLLGSRHYGERWAQVWLDLAGYADSEGIIDEDRVRPHAWRYRDYVIRALNSDRTYDQFLTEQLAGDELIPAGKRDQVTSEMIDILAATGFLRMAPDGTYSLPNGSLAERMTVIADEIEVLGSSVLGLTVGCARCHDHKYDPISQHDYYRFSAILQAAFDPYDWIKPTERHLEVATEQDRHEISEFNAPIQIAVQELERELEENRKPYRKQLFEKRLAKLPQNIQGDLRDLISTPKEKRNGVQQYLAESFHEFIDISDEELTTAFPEFKTKYDEIKQSLEDKKKKLRPTPRIRALYDMGGEPSPTYLLVRGEAQSIGHRVYPGVPEVLTAGLKPYGQLHPGKTGETSGNRLALARWLTQPNHPLTSRVMVNRLWMNHFGHGLVSTPANFGRTGTPPSHPQLLDWLATEFVRTGWSIKAMHRLMMTSEAYQQSSQPDEMTVKGDPGNILFSRMPLQRMSAEVLHDSILRVVGRLDDTSFGEPVPVEKHSNGEILPKASEQGRRRAIYVLKRRRTPLTLLDVFDLPRLSPNCTERTVSNVAPQALQLLNSEKLIEDARFLAARLIDEYPHEPEKQLRSLYQRVLSRTPTEKEAKSFEKDLSLLALNWRSYLEEKRFDAPRNATAQWYALGSLAHTLLNSAEFIYID